MPSNLIPISACEVFDNSDGELVCGIVSHQESDLPNGSYLQSCGGCRVSTREGEIRVLSCSACKNELGRSVASEIVLDELSPCAQIGNRKGELICEDFSGADSLGVAREGIVRDRSHDEL